MIVEVIDTTSEDGMRTSYVIKINGKREFSAFCDMESPEDNTMHRSFSEIYSFPSLLKRAYEAGKAGEPFELTVGSEDEDEE